MGKLGVVESLQEFTQKLFNSRSLLLVTASEPSQALSSPPTLKSSAFPSRTMDSPASALSLFVNLQTLKVSALMAMSALTAPTGVIQTCVKV